MNKFIKFAGVCTAIAALAFSSVAITACGHTHKWEWRRTETEHWQVCTVKGCEKEQNRGTHDDSVCSDCAEFKALAFGDLNSSDSAHNDFVKEANVWFPETGKKLGYTYEYIDKNFDLLNDEKLAEVDLVMFLNDRPYGAEQQEAFQRYMENGGAWMGFHICAFYQFNNGYQYWPWYQNEFIGCGGHINNTWNPTSEPLHIETYNHFTTENLDQFELKNDSFVSAPCEWYNWTGKPSGEEYVNDSECIKIIENDDLTVLLTLNPTQDNPAGDSGNEIWYSGCYPIAWANKNYNMVYMNWGHNLQDYNNGAEGKSSSTFASEAQNQFMIDAMFGLTKSKYKMSE